MTLLVAARQHAGRVRPFSIVQGEQHVSSDPEVAISTILGSCVAACIRGSSAASVQIVAVAGAQGHIA